MVIKNTQISNNSMPSSSRKRKRQLVSSASSRKKKEKSLSSEDIYTQLHEERLREIKKTGKIAPLIKFFEEERIDAIVSMHNDKADELSEKLEQLYLRLPTQYDAKQRIFFYNDLKRMYGGAVVWKVTNSSLSEQQKRFVSAKLEKYIKFFERVFDKLSKQIPKNDFFWRSFQVFS